MRLILFILFLSITGCYPFSPEGTYMMKNSPKTIMKINPNNKFQFILDYQNPYLSSHKQPERYYFRTDGIWRLRGRNLILNSGDDSLQYDLYRVTEENNGKKDTSQYEFYDMFNERIPILYVKSGNGNIQIMNNSPEYFSYGNRKDTLQFYFFGYRPVTILSSGETGRDYTVYVVPEYRPRWIKDLKLRVKILRKKGKRIITLNWKYLKERLKKESDKKYSGPPMF